MVLTMCGVFKCNTIPTRAVIAIMMFTATFIAYTVRVNMSINIIAMIQPFTNNDSNYTYKDSGQSECITTINNNDNNRFIFINNTQNHSQVLNYGPRYKWNSRLQGHILGSYFWGAIITCIPGGLLAERIGPKRVVLIATIISGILTILGPIVADVHYMALITSRFFIGLTGGVIYPCMHCLVSRWSPPEERGKFIFALMGGTFGTVIALPILGTIIQQWGWAWSFYINGIITLLWCFLWIFLVYDYPNQHPHITDDEKEFIKKSLGDYSQSKNGFPPYKAMFLSIPFWGLILLHFGNAWGLFFLMTVGPSYLSKVLGFNLGNTGFLSSLPYLCRLIFGFLFGLIGDFIRKRKIVSTTVVRKGFVLFSHIIPGLLLLGLIITECNVFWPIIILILSLGFNGASSITNLQNSQDLAPNYAGTIYGIINCIGSTTGFLTPLIVGYITEKHNGLYEWHIIFTIGALVYILTGTVFCIFGSAELQKWNHVERNKKESKGVENPAFENNEMTNVSNENYKF